MNADELISQYRGWLYKVATSLLYPASPDIEDLVQEGRIAMWNALDSYRPELGALPAWLTGRARHRMLDAVTDKRWTGQPARRRGRNIYEEPRNPLSLDAEQTEEGATLADLVADPTDREALDLAYHDREIKKAIEQLTPRQRQYVETRFWIGLNTTELTKLYSYDPSGLWHSKKNGAKWKLRKSLARLESAV